MKQLLVLLSVVAAAWASAGPACAATEESIVAEAIVDAPPAEVWKAFTTSGGLESWMASRADIDLRVDGLMRATHDPKGTLGDAGTIENRVLAYEPERLLAIRVSKAPADFPFRDQVASMWTVIHFLPAADDRTLVRVVGMGFAADPQAQKMKDFFARGNAFTLAQLQKRFGK